VLEDVFEVVLNVIGGVLEFIFPAFCADFSWPDTRFGRVLLGVVLVVLGGIIGLELR